MKFKTIISFIAISLYVAYQQGFFSDFINKPQADKNHKTQTVSTEKKYSNKKNNDNNSILSAQEENKQYCSQNLLDGKFPSISKGYYNGSGKENEIVSLCYPGFNVQYKFDFKMPLYSTEKLTIEKEKRANVSKRADSFYPDPVLLKIFGDKNTLKTTDFNNAKYKDIRFDRGHLAASRNQAIEDRYNSFYLSNIALQSSNNNRFIWADIEKASRCLVKMYHSDVYVVTVPVVNIAYYQKNNLPLKFFSGKRNIKILIPDFFAKAIYIKDKNIIGVYLTNNDNSQTHYDLISVNDLKKISYIDVFPTLNNELKNQVNKNELNLSSILKKCQ